MSFSLRHGQIFRKPCLVALMRLSVFGPKSAARVYYACSSLVVRDRMSFATISDYCVSRETSHIPVHLFLLPFIIFYRIFGTDVSCLSSVMLHPSSHKTLNDISGVVFLLGFF